jgi:hypothetical protein
MALTMRRLIREVSRSPKASRAFGLCACLAAFALIATPAVSSGDRFVQLGPKLVGHGQERGQGYFGRSVALSGNGKTAVIGAAYNEIEDGAAWIFVRSGSTWKQQGARLGTETANSFGSSVAVSSDGNTVLISEPVGAGRVWVYVRAGGKWKQQEKLTGRGARGLSEFGDSIALSGDAKTAIVGGSLDHKDVGAAWVFTRSGAHWKQQGPKLTGRGERGTGQFGLSVALSADARTAIVGAPGDGRGGQGATWIFTRSGSQWKQQGAKLTGPGGGGGFGASVALSANGGTALVGSRGLSRGAAWIFIRSGSAWRQQGPKLTGHASQLFGESVALTADGKTALIGDSTDHGDAGAAWLFRRSGSGRWTRVARLSGRGERGDGSFGSSVSFAVNGKTALIGGPDDNNHAGAVWIFAAAR